MNKTIEDNSGDTNSGDDNSGYYNSGDYNSGDCNSGNYNSGNYNSGNCNSGFCNSGNRNSGIFCSKEPTVTMFNKPTDLMFDSPEIQKLIGVIGLVKRVCTWVKEIEMTKQEKVNNPNYKTTGGFLKKRSFKYCWKKSWAEFTSEQKNIILNAPNFDAEVFKEITGVDVGRKSSITLEVTEEQLAKIKEIINN